jgi:LIM domain kinase 1
MSKLAGNAEVTPGTQMYDLSRTKSFRVEPPNGHYIFRASDLVIGEMLGKGFFGESSVCKNNIALN